MWDKIKNVYETSETNESNNTNSLLKWLYNKIKKSIDKTKKPDTVFNNLDWKILNPWEKEIININGKQIWFILDKNNKFMLDINGEKTVLTWIWKVRFKKDEIECVKLVSWLNRNNKDTSDELDISSMLKNWKWELKYSFILDKLN